MNPVSSVPDPIEFCKVLWPDVHFFDKQQEILRSVRDNDLTLCVAANKVGKDFTAAAVVLWTYLVHPECRIVTTSVKDDHLRVLWGEIGRFIETSKVPLTKDKGGPLVVKHRDIRKVVNGTQCPISYLRGMVSERGEGMAGHHAAWTLCVIDEASGVSNVVFTQAETWAKRFLIFGNPNSPSPGADFFYKLVKQGDVVDPASR